MENTNLDIIKENNKIKIAVIGLANKYICWKSSVKISSNSGNSNIVNNGSELVNIVSTDTVNINEFFKFNFLNTTSSNLIINSINQNIIKKSLIYNNNENKSLIELYDPSNNIG